MQDLQKIKRCLISVSNKEGIVDLAKYLVSKNVEIISTGGTRKLIADNNLPVKDISDFTGFPEIMDGRVKTLHPNVHGALLGVLDDEKHMIQAKENNIEAIDLTIINLYPFVETVAKTDDEDEIIENIDIGGPSMVRSTAKNFAYKAIITAPDQYQDLIKQMDENDGATNFEFRKKLAKAAFAKTAKYDTAISNWFNRADEAPEKLAISANLKQTLRYGENSHQNAAIYSNSNSGIVNAKQIQGKELSYNNFNDADGAYNLILEFDKPSCAIIKHANPCGVAQKDNLLDAFKEAFAADSKSAFGGIVALNGTIRADLAEEISKIFFEVIIAKGIDEEAAEILATKKNLRVLIADFSKDVQKQVKSVSGGFLMQDLDQKLITKNDLELVSTKSANDEEIAQLIFAMSVCKHVKSNAICLVKDFKTAGIGGGQTSRVDAMEIACKKGEENGISGGYLASDAFFPFADNIEIAAKYGVKAIVATGGSIRDEEVIAKANEEGIALYFIKTRHFKH